MIADFGNDIKPFLKGFYANAYFYPGLANDGMDSLADVEAFDVDSIGEENNLQSEENESIR